MSSFSDYWENKILNYIFGKAALTPPTIYLGLSTVEPAEDGSNLAEPSGNAYQRVETSAGDWDTASEGSLDNINEIFFPMATGSWGTVTHFVLFDSQTGGNMLAYGSLSPPKTIGSGDIVRIVAGDLVISLD